MNQFSFVPFIANYHALSAFSGYYLKRKMEGDGASLLETVQIKAVLNRVAGIQAIASAQRLEDIERSCAFMEREFNKPGVDMSTAVTLIQGFQEHMLQDRRKRKFVYISADRTEFLNQAGKSPLFGEKVAVAFPSASRDIVEAGDCLAAECGTASVFHLMRAAEFSLRAVARDRDVTFKDRPLEDKQWGEILPNLASKASDLASSDRRKWSSSEVRDEQIRFYAEIVQELRGFNDAWRRHISHADSQAFYERDEALGIFKHVRLFM